MGVLLSITYWLGYQHGGAAPRRVTAPSSLRQVGLTFRGYHNDIGRFTATGPVRGM